MSDNWPLEQDRQFNSEFFTKEELTAKQQENDWLRNRDVEDGVYADYPTYDYSYTYYECKTIDELKKAFLYGNWSIRMGFTYKNLAFINQINAGDEWWTLKKFEDGSLLYFDSITMIRTINHETKTWVADYNTSEYENGSHFRVIRPYAAREHAEALTTKFHKDNPDFVNKEARYVRGEAKDPAKDFGIYFIDINTEYFPDYIEQLLKATYKQCNSLDYLDEEFKEKWKELPELRAYSARELKERLT